MTDPPPEDIVQAFRRALLAKQPFRRALVLGKLWIEGTAQHVASTLDRGFADDERLAMSGHDDFSAFREHLEALLALRQHELRAGLRVPPPAPPPRPTPLREVKVQQFHDALTQHTLLAEAVMFGQYAEAMRYLEDVADTIDPECRGDPGYPTRGLLRGDAAMYKAHRGRLEQILQARERHAQGPEEAERYARELEVFERYQREREEGMRPQMERAWERERARRRPEGAAAAESHANEGVLALPQANRHANERQANAQVDSENVHEAGTGVRHEIAPPAVSERVNHLINEDGATDASGSASERQANEGGGAVRVNRPVNQRRGNERHDPAQATAPEASEPEHPRAGAPAPYDAPEAANVLAFRAPWIVATSWARR